ncbi:hypothetical protein A1O7_01635 [Cladophialophora yegresii CBS 114405]|uniref:Uncharacterized protein n=1 Tax=Cladophialophora yegresii CBS 114405 TaxID=1182544 RepID=W9X492_9EURO|nr:uncharacterized protein A1O7_01635 [Cladophialophora yegresii CBS 114405]EXJ65294.1 hypothetical protein A1O7_01635 [Cladophialophora yegresii CBS 114405]
MTVQTKDKVSYVHFGRGGAGNCTDAPARDARRPLWASDSKSASTPAQFNIGRRYSTGIGGTGNFSFPRKVDDAKDAEGKNEDMARLLYDRSAPGIVLVEGGHHTGIGGFANRYQPTDLEDQEARLNNENMRRQSLAGVARRRASMAMSTCLPLKEPCSRTGSLASMRYFVMGMGRTPSKV